MKTLALLGSPRKKGNSEVLLEAMLKGVEEAGGRIETIRLCDLDIKPCLGCGGCDKTGICVQKDDMTALYDKIVESPRIILTSPIYFYNVTAQAKAFIDRTQALWCRKYLAIKKGEWQEDPNRRGFFLSVAATKGSKVFEGAVLTMKYAYDAMDVSYAGDLLIKQIEHRGDMRKDAESLKLAEQTGRDFMK
jgi:multimeric flavodoxin WrbA